MTGSGEVKFAKAESRLMISSDKMGFLQV
jgi:hypothetical protein